MFHYAMFRAEIEMVLTAVEGSQGAVIKERGLIMLKCAEHQEADGIE